MPQRCQRRLKVITTCTTLRTHEYPDTRQYEFTISNAPVGSAPPDARLPLAIDRYFAAFQYARIKLLSAALA